MRRHGAAEAWEQVLPAPFRLWYDCRLNYDAPGAGEWSHSYE